MKPMWPTTLASKSSAIARKACGLLLVLIALSSPAIAQQGQNNNNQGQNNNNQGQNVRAPEIDPGALSGAVTLLVSGTLILTDRLRRK